jgi:hypothetical protein
MFSVYSRSALSSAWDQYRQNSAAFRDMPFPNYSSLADFLTTDLFLMSHSAVSQQLETIEKERGLIAAVASMSDSP